MGGEGEFRGDGIGPGLIWGGDSKERLRVKPFVLSYPSYPSSICVKTPKPRRFGQLGGLFWETAPLFTDNTQQLHSILVTNNSDSPFKL